MVRVGYAPTKRGKTDSAKFWTMIQARPFPHKGKLFGVQFFANKPRRSLIVSLFRGAGKGKFKPVFSYRIPGKKIKAGLNTVGDKIPSSQHLQAMLLCLHLREASHNVVFLLLQFKVYNKGIKVRRGDRIGFTWPKGGVLAFDYTKKKGAYFENKVIPKLNRAARYHKNRHTNRNYAFRGLYVPRPGKPVGRGNTSCTAD